LGETASWESGSAEIPPRTHGAGRSGSSLSFDGSSYALCTPNLSP